MFYSKIDKIARKLYIKVGTNEYAMTYTLSALEELETRLGKSVIQSLDDLQNVKLATLVDALWIALKVDMHELTREDAAAILSGYMHEEGVPGMANLYAALIALSGLLGVEGSANMLESLGVTDVKPKSAAKNA